MTTTKTMNPARVLQEVFPRTLLEEVAADCGLIQRNRQFQPVEFFWALMSTILSGSCQSIAAVLIEYGRLAKQTMNRSSFHRHLNAAMVEFLRRLFAHACAEAFPKTQTPPLFRRFTQTLVQDSTVLRLRDAMAARWPGSATAAAAKLNVVQNLNGGTAHRVQLVRGTRSEVKLAMINATLKGTLSIFDMGYQKYANFARIERHQGFFLVRLKDGLNPRIVDSNLTHRGPAIPVAGRRLQEVLPLLKREALDVTIGVKVSLQGQPGPIPLAGHQPQTYHWRVVGLRDAETDRYHLYLTNIPVDWLSAEEIGLAYSCRWEIERLFAEFKGAYALGTWSVTRDEAMQVHVYGVLLAWALSRQLRNRVMAWTDQTDAATVHLNAPTMRWAKALLHLVRDIVSALIARRRCDPHVVTLLQHAARDPNRGRPPLLAREARHPRNARVAPDAA